MNKPIIRQITVIVAIAAVIVVNVLANALPFNGQGTGEISDRFQVLFVPAGYVFAIWGLIYIGLIAYAVFQALPAQRDNPRLRSIFWPVIVGSIANIVWIFLWHYDRLALTVPVMLILLASLIVVYLRLGIQKTPVSRGERWAVHVPFSIYLGWITVATIANITNLLWSADWNGFGLSAQTWFLVMLAAAIIIAAAMALTRHDVAYLLVLVWAVAGIAVKHAGAPVVSTAAWVATAVLGVLVIVALVVRRPRAAVAS
jgi:hypothetical protein